MKNLKRITGLAIGFALLAPGASAYAADDCVSVKYQAHLEPALSGPIEGTLCSPPGATTVQLLVHGSGYNRYYWDLPHQPDTYSYQRAAYRRGYATLNIDRLGSGESWRPLSTFVTTNANAAILHELVQALRDGRFRGPYSKVVLVGHSYGTLLSWVEAGNYNDVDAVVATGFAHKLNPVANATLFSSLYPATLDPKFASSGFDPGYLTSRPGTRSVFYNAPNADPAVHALDEQLKDTLSATETQTAFPEFVSPSSLNIDVPVYAVIGKNDSLFCDVTALDCSSNATVAAGECPFYGAQAAVEAFAVPDTGHNVTLHLNAQQVQGAILDFVDRAVGPAPPQPSCGS
jgi:pimeloyl-ACP methyl ester carboxylesterase